MSVRSVDRAYQAAISDRILTTQEALDTVGAAGKISRGEAEALIEKLQSGLQFARGDDVDKIGDLIQQVALYKNHQIQTNDQRDRLVPGYERKEAARLQEGVTTHSLGGTVLPEGVKSAVREALNQGAQPYDVMRLESPELADDPSADDAFLSIGGEFSPYAQEQRAVDTLRFDATEITPAKIKEDMTTSTRHQVYTGYKEEPDLRGGTYKVAQYRQAEGVGSGSTSTHYAPGVSHPGNGRFARSANGAKWTHNMAMMSDGTVHLLPAMRRAQGAGVILTNPSLARGERMLFNGHMTLRNGVVTSIGMSGRLHKLATNGDHKFANPIPILEAWGFEIAPSLRLQFEGRRADPEFDKTTIG